MTEPAPLDPERIAAFLDGRLDASEAAPLGEELARADKETRATFADAASVLAEVKRAADRTGGDGEAAFRRARWLAAAILCAVVALAIAALVHRAATLTTPTADGVAGGHQYPWTSWMPLNDGYQSALQLSFRKGDNDFIERGMVFVRLQNGYRQDVSGRITFHIVNTTSGATSKTRVSVFEMRPLSTWEDGGDWFLAPGSDDADPKKWDRVGVELRDIHVENVHLTAR